MSHWAPYQPTNALPWNLQRVHHLHRRAAFGATWPKIQRDLTDGHEAAVSRLLAGESRLQGAPDEFESLSTVIGQAAVASGSAERLKAWWLHRCLFTPFPLQERLTLMWHNHFATSNLKVDDLKGMQRQNATLRQFALAPFGDLIRGMVRDPALLSWLDAPSNRRGHPNENLARELMELFTLGIGHYTEVDVKEAARALTGWTVRQGEFRDQAAVHDAGEKKILGRAGSWTGDDLVDILLQLPATSRRLAWRLTGEFFGEGVVSQPALEELADGLERNHLDIRWGVETILRSGLFFAESNIASRVADPVSFLVGPLVALECWRELPSTLVLAEWVSRMGQDLFYPPNVGGWNSGRAWLSTRTVIARTNCMAALIDGSLNTPARPPAINELIAKYCGKQSSAESERFLPQLLFGRETLDKQSPSADVLVQLLTSPEAHLH